MKDTQIRTEQMGINGLNFASKYNSPSRSVMFGSSHLAQRLIINGCEEKIIQTGVEHQFSEHTFNIKMPENGRIIKVIDRYPPSVGSDAIPFNPETIVIFENEETHEIDCLVIPQYASYHQHFGFEYQFKEAAEQLKPGAYIAKGTIFADTNSVTENGGWAYGTNLNMAFMSVPSVSEDGIMISRDVLDRLKFKVYETRVVEFGSDSFPLNLFGTTTDYRPFKDIGEELSADGLLMMLRSYDDDLVPVDMSVYDTMEPDYIFDRAVYVRGDRGRIIDIKVTSNNAKTKHLPDEMAAMVSKYEQANLKFHREMIHTEEQIRYERKRKYGDIGVKISPRLHRLLVESLAIVDPSRAKMKQQLNLVHRKTPIDEYRIEFVVEYEMTPNIGFKLSGVAGDKGVICKIEEPENMPIDEDGNRADVVMDGASTIARMNVGRLHEHYLAGAARDIRKEIRRRLNITDARIMASVLHATPDTVIKDAYGFLMGFYDIISPLQAQFYTELSYDAQLDHLLDVINRKIYLYIPTECSRDGLDTIRQIEQYHRPTYGPVTYTGNSGIQCITQNRIRIAPLYMMLLEKIADDWSAVSSGKLQHFGVLAPMSKSEKFSYPFRNTPIRTIGETEGRIFAGYCGREAIAEMMDRSNNPVTQRNVVWNILDAPTPTNINHVVDRQYIPLGQGKSIGLVKHILNCSGIRLVYQSA